MEPTPYSRGSSICYAKKDIDNSVNELYNL